MSNLTENDVRRIVREEIGRSFRFLAAEATDYSGYDEPEIESRARDALSKVVDKVITRLPHADDCVRYLSDEEFTARGIDWFDRYNCTCGVDPEND